MAKPSSKSLDNEPKSQVKISKGPPKSKKVKPWVSVLAGMLAGITEACSLQPLDVAKTRLQLDHGGKYKGMIDCVRTIVREEGVAALYKGLTPFVTHLTVKYALRFGSYSFFKRQLGVVPGSPNEAIGNFTAGLLSGLTEAVLIVTPFETVKIRLQKQRGTENLRLRGPIHAAMTIVKEEGPRALWNGVAPTMLRQGSNQAFNFMAFAYLSEKVFGRVEGDGKQQAAWKPFLTGLVSSTIGPLTNCPLDVAKSRLQAQENRGEEKARYRGFVHCIRSVAKEEGVAALWKGITPRLMRLAPGQAITWTIVQRVQTTFEDMGIGLVEPAKKY